MARYMRSDLGAGHTRLRPPVVVTIPTPPFAPIRVYLDVHLPEERRSRATRRNPDYELKPPTVVGAAIAFPGPRVKLAPLSLGERRKQDVFSRLQPPTVLAAAGIFFGPRVQLNVHLPEQKRIRVTRRSPQYEIKLPAVIDGGIAWHGPGVYLTHPSIAARRRQEVSYRLAPPAVLVADVRYPGLYESLARSRHHNPRTTYALRPPVVLAVAGAFYGPDVTLAKARRPRTDSSRLQPPTVVFPFFARRTSITLARIKPAPTVARLQPPTVVFPFFARPTEITLARIRPPLANARLSAPVVVGAAALARPLKTALAYSRRGKARPTYVFPYVIFAREAFGYVAIQLVRRPTPSTVARLQPPAVVTAVEQQVYYGPEVTLVKARRPRPVSRLQPPTVVFPFFARPTALALARITPSPTISRLAPPTVVFGFVARDIQTTFVRIAPPLANARLSPPTVVFLAVEIYGPEVSLARITVPPTVHRLSPPTVVFPFFARAIDTTLARITPPATTSRLDPPVVVGAFIAQSIKRTLARITPPPTTSKLSAPAVVGAGIRFPGLYESLARSKPHYLRTTSALRPPVVLVVTDVFYGPDVTLAKVRRPRPLSRLSPPAVVAPVLFFGPKVSLAPSFRGTPKSELKPPTVVDQQPAFLPPARVLLAPSFRGTPRSQLFPPAVVGAGRVNPGIRRYLVARQTRVLYRLRKTVARLEPPVVVRTPTFVGPLTTLAPQKRGRPTVFLTPPAVVFLAVEIFGPEITLRPSRRPITKSRLRPPAVVGIRPHAPITLWLTYSKRGAPSSVLRPPAVVAPVLFFGPKVSLAPSFRGVPKSLLKKPTVVREADRFFGPVLHLAKIKPPKVIHFKISAVVATPFIPDRGRVCGFDIAGSFICFVELPGTKVSGSDRAGSNVHGTTERSAKVTGGDNAGGSVSGGDRAAE